jgi:predicted component of type VI protein secretion system
MMPELEIDALLQPLPGDQPCGVSLIHDPEYDAIRTARRADDASVPAGIWQTTLKVADWAAVEAGCRRVLSNRSKDLTIAAWLGEAWLNRYGVPALPHCFQLSGLMRALLGRPPPLTTRRRCGISGRTPCLARRCLCGSAVGADRTLRRV